MATNTKVLQEGNSPEDHAHVSVSAPIDLKKRELADAPMTKKEKAFAKIRRAKQSKQKSL
jgi:hypothetical protein